MDLRVLERNKVMECCNMDIEELYKQEDEDVCESCYDRIEAHIEDMMLSRAKEDFYDRNKKYHDNY